MATIASLVIKVSADTGGAEQDIKSFGSKVGGGFRKALLPATAALGVMGVVGKLAFDNLQDGAKNAHQTEQVIKTTGGAAHVTADHVDELAMSLRRKAGVDDDVIHVGENMLLTFTNVRNEVGKGNDIFDQATSTVLDMSQALGQDTKSSAIQLGKALNDPIKGVSALQRVGVSFTAGQKEQIKTLVDSGHAMDAQKIILHELSREFGGAATNIDPTARSMANLKLDALDMASSLVQSLMPAIRGTVAILGAVTQFMTKHGTATKVVVSIVAALATTVVAVNAAMALFAKEGAVVRAATAAWTAAQWLLNTAFLGFPLIAIVAALVAVGVAFVVLWKKSETFRNIVTGAWNAIKNVTLAVFNFVRDHIKLVMAALFVIMTGGAGALVLLVIAKWDAIKGATSAAWNALRSIVTGAVDAVRSKVSAVFDTLGAIVAKAAGAVRAGAAAIASAFDPVLEVLRTVISIAGQAANAIQTVLNVAGKVSGAVGGALGHLGIGGNAQGTSYWPGGLSVVGERGPELVNMPRGSQVLSNDRSQRAGSDGPLIGEVHVHNETDIEVLATRVAAKLAFA